jgi:uncharacterized protein (DUF58 family)
MDTKELIKQVRKIEIKTKGLSNHIFSGEYHSAFKGRGMAFSEVRNYQAGDEIRTIDWNVTARFNEPFVKVFEEERELTVMLLVDLSGSQNFGITSKTKRELITELAAVLSFSAIANNDKIGLIIFTSEVELFIPPKKGKNHTLRIIRELIDFEPKNHGTDIGEALRYFSKTVKKRSIAFLLSDFDDQNYLDAVKMTSKKHDLVGFRIMDKSELELPNSGNVDFLNQETGRYQSINTSSRKVRKSYKEDAEQRNLEINGMLKKAGIYFATVDTEEDYVKPMMILFNKRG